MGETLGTHRYGDVRPPSAPGEGRKKSREADQPKPSEAPEGPGAPGLVHSQTSDTRSSADPLDPGATRLRRLKRALVTGAIQHEREATQGGFRVRVAMLTLTYRPGVDYQARQVSELLKHIRHWLARRGHALRAEWCLELTKAGRPHYHVLIWLPIGLTLPKPDNRGWWPHGLTRIEWARRPVGYIAKYASKGGNRGELPARARLFAVLGLSAQGRAVKRWWCAPSWVKAAWPDAAADVSPALGGGWVARATGEWQPSPWRVTFAHGKVWLAPRDDASQGPGPGQRV